MIKINQGELCLTVVHGLLNKHGRKISLDMAILGAESIGWCHNLTTFRQKRKHFYEVLRVARRDGKTNVVLRKNYLIDPST